MPFRYKASFVKLKRCGGRVRANNNIMDYNTKIEKIHKPEDYENFDEYSSAVAEETIEKSLLVWTEHINKSKE